MLLYTRKAVPKEPKRRSRAGCTHCKLKKKKCDEKRPCQRCVEHGTTCEYEIRINRKRERNNSRSTDASSELVTDLSSEYYDVQQNDVFFDHDPLEMDEVVGSPFSTESHLSSSIIRSSRAPDLAMIAPSPIASPLFEFNTPAFVEFSDKPNRRALVDHFCNVLSHLIVFKEDSGNPFRQLVLPLSHSSTSVLNAIYALASAHMEFRGVQTAEPSVVFHNRALQSLAQLIERNETCDKKEILGAIMLLVYYEAVSNYHIFLICHGSRVPSSILSCSDHTDAAKLVQRGNSQIVQGHLKGAMAIMNSEVEISSPTSLFLTRAFRFYDVITALSLGTAPNSPYEASTIPLGTTQTSNPSHVASSSNNIDVLLGMSIDLWPIIHRLAHLSTLKQLYLDTLAQGDVHKTSILRSELESSSNTIEIALTSWIPTIPANLANVETSDDSARFQSILYNAEAYRYSSLIHLYRTIQGLARHDDKVQAVTNSSLQACANVVSGGEQSPNAPLAALLWPLFVAACEAITEEDRSLAQQAFTGVERKQGMINITCAWEVVIELWRRVDDGELDVDWRDIAQQMGYNLVFG